MYRIARRNFITIILEKCLLSSWVFWAILRLLKLVIPRSRRILKRNVKLNIAKYNPYSEPTIFWTVLSIPKIQTGFTRKFKNRSNTRFVRNFLCISFGSALFYGVSRWIDEYQHDLVAYFFIYLCINFQIFATKLWFIEFMSHLLTLNQQTNNLEDCC